jgi:hypothetical protein
MVLFLILCVLLLVLYLAFKTAALSKGQALMAASIETELKEIKARQETPPKSLPYGWFDDGWPWLELSDEEERVPLENPTPYRDPDAYATRMFMSEYRAIRDPLQRKEFLRELIKAEVWMEAEFLDLVYGDENAHVRAWAAAHLYTDYTNSDDHRVIRNYEPRLLEDPDPLVRAALWSNPKCQQLPWSMISIAENWKERFRAMSPLERLGLMRNPDLSMHYVVALLDTASEELHISRDEHAEILRAAAVNPDLVGSSRRTGRNYWTVEGHANSPFEEYGRMWELCLEKWLSDRAVPYFFIKYIQTTPKVKLSTYNRLLERGDDHNVLRQALIESCDPIRDGDVLKVAWNDPDKNCQEAARGRVGIYGKFLGLASADPKAHS